MPVSPEWIEQRRGTDGELLGWIMPVADDFVAINLLGREFSDATDWLTVEELLETTGIGYLADVYELTLDDGSWLRVRIVEVSQRAIRVKKDDWGAIDSPQLEFVLPFPAPETLRLSVGADADADTGKE